MARALVLGNGGLTVTLDKYGFVRDLYYPYVGLANHVSGHKHRIGVMVNGVFSWLDDGHWQISLGYKPETMVGYLVCKNEGLGVSVVMEDVVYNESDVFLRQMDIYNHTGEFLDVKVFFHQLFLIDESRKRNTAFYDPTHNAVVHYKGRRVFIVNGRTKGGSTIDDFSMGAYGIDGKEGTFKDAEDGNLGKNAVEHGSVDSVVRFCTSCEGKEKATIYYWICAGKSLEEAYQLNTMVMTKTPQAMIHSTQEYWHAWIGKRDWQLDDILTPEQKKLFDTSLFILRSHTDDGGGIIASADGAMIEYGKDDYTYVWPRDAAHIASVLDKADFTEVTKPFFKFAREVLHQDGYLHHRFNTDKSLGSTWHSTLSQQEWLKDKILQLPIQEDETAGVLYSLWHHYLASKDLEFIEDLYKPFIEKAANFMVNFRNKETGLPMPSYDLWEEKIGVSTYTCAAVYGGLMAAAQFSEILGKRNHMREYREAAKSVKKAAITHLYNDELRSFIRIAHFEGSKLVHDQTVDASSLYGLWYFKMLPQDDPLFVNTLKAVQERLTNPTDVGGILRYERDEYFKDTDKSNPWLITTMWEAQRRLNKPQVTQEDFDYTKHVLDWVVKHMYPSGVLAEQLNPYTGASRSATPLAWSHAVYVELILDFRKALEQAGQIKNDEEVTPLHEL